MKTFWINLKTNRVAQAGIALILASAFQQFPWLISWMGEDVAKTVQQWIFMIKAFALGTIALFIQQITTKKE